MAWVKCPSCQATISDVGDACPKCGSPVRTSRNRVDIAVSQTLPTLAQAPPKTKQHGVAGTAHLPSDVIALLVGALLLDVLTLFFSRLVTGGVADYSALLLWPVSRVVGAIGVHRYANFRGSSISSHILWVAAALVLPIVAILIILLRSQTPQTSAAEEAAQRRRANTTSPGVIALWPGGVLVDIVSTALFIQSAPKSSDFWLSFLMGILMAIARILSGIGIYFYVNMRGFSIVLRVLSIVTALVSPIGTVFVMLAIRRYSGRW